LYCPSCGVKNEGSPLKCFICGYILPTGERAAAADDRRPRRATMSPASAEPYAAIGDRMLAVILDRVVVLSLLAIPAALLAQRWSDAAPVRIVIVGGVVAVLAVLVYHIVLEALFRATLGKGLLGLQVRNGSGGRPWLASTVRNTSRLIDAMFFYAIAFLVAVFTARRQRLGDLFAGTTVIEQRVVWGARVALIFIWLVLVVGSLWLASRLCPSCLPDRSRFAF
jgi:uncharacterized RDD family membrane protein YckC